MYNKKLVIYFSFFSALLLASLISFTGCSKETQPEVEDLFYLRGSFNNWTLDTPFIKDGNQYYAQVTLKLGRHSLKVGDKEWKHIDLGSKNSDLIITDVSYELHPKGVDFLFDVEVEQATFVVSVTGLDINQPKIKIIKGKLLTSG